LSSIYKNNEVVFHLCILDVIFKLQKLGLSSIYKQIEVVFQLKTYWGPLPFTKTEVIFHLQNKSGCLTFANKHEVVFQIGFLTYFCKVTWATLPEKVQMNFPTRAELGKIAKYQ
jgi:hypothetical protein